MPGWRAGPSWRVVSPFGRLDLDDVGAEIAEALRGEGTEDDGGGVEDANSRERAGHGGIIWE
jgi:hypothetical protein